MSRRAEHLRRRMFTMHAESNARARQAARWRVSPDVDETLREFGESVAAEMAIQEGLPFHVGPATVSSGGTLLILGLVVVADTNLPPNSIVLEEGAPISPSDDRMAVR